MAKIYVTRLAEANNLEMGHILMEDLGQKNLMPNIYEGLTKIQVNFFFKIIFTKNF